MNTYSDIINYPHYELRKHQRMSIENRSAQFSPFSALTGYSDEIIESSKILESKRDITDDALEILDRKLRFAFDNKIEVIFLIYQHDKKKNGGNYFKCRGKVFKIDYVYKRIILENKKVVMVKDIIDVNILN